jgi:hypothetical protein
MGTTGRRPAHVRRVLEITNLTRILLIHPTVEDALEDDRQPM